MVMKSLNINDILNLRTTSKWMANLTKVYFRTGKMRSMRKGLLEDTMNVSCEFIWENNLLDQVFLTKIGIWVLENKIMEIAKRCNNNNPSPYWYFLQSKVPGYDDWKCDEGNKTTEKFRIFRVIFP